MARVATGTYRGLGPGSVSTITARYVDGGWKVDRAVMDALACVSSARDMDAVKQAIRAVYRDWLESAALAMQQAIAQESPVQAQEPFAGGNQERC